jgi:glucose/arabinose dehydrogenase
LYVAIESKLNHEKSSFLFLLTLFWSLLLISSLTFNQPAKGQQSIYSYQTAFPNLTFNQPDGIVNDNNSNRLFVTEQGGVIWMFDNSQNTNVKTAFLDISDRVVSGGEQGLLGLAFHPDFKQNGYFYVDYTAPNPLRTVIARYKVLANNANMADKGSEQILLTVNQPFTNHNGGQLAFGPDGYLYIGLGDGGSGGDPFGNGQNRSSLLGKILRINVDLSSNGRNYSIPSDNPFVSNTLGFREEIYAFGFRNPWRFSFDSVSTALWAGDVGQDTREEVDVVKKGVNYGWNIMEGTLCYNPASGCDTTGLELPVWSYTHSVGNAIIGGFVYHGLAMPDLAGAYVYGDFGSGRIWALRLNDTATPANALLTNTGLNIASFGLDTQKELYFSAYDGKIYKLTSSIIPEIHWQTSYILILISSAIIVALFKTKHLKPKFWWQQTAKSRSKPNPN